MAIQNNRYADVPADSQITTAAAEFIEQSRYDNIPSAALVIGRRCVLDGMGLLAAGLNHETTILLAQLAADQGGREDALLLGHGDEKVPAAMAARVLGTAGHAHDWDDSQVSTDPDHIYGLLTHPTIPALTSALVVAQARGAMSGKDFMLAFLTGFEVESKISEWMFSQHYKRGFHSSGTVGTFGAFAAAAKLLRLEGDVLRHGLGLTASFAAGIRCNFGTMTKPLHVGRAAENGVTAALLAEQGYTADKQSLDGPWGYFAVHGGGISVDKLARQSFGTPWSIIDPGVSIKPYPCGVLTHPTIDLMLRLVTENDIQPDDIEHIVVDAGSNILNPIRYPIAGNHLEAKFSLQAVLAMVALQRKAGKVEFRDEFVQALPMQDMQKRVETHFDSDIESLGFDKMRSRIHIRLKGGEIVSGDADERYRGGPENPLTNDELKDKVRSCCEGVLAVGDTERLIDAALGVTEMEDSAALAGYLRVRL